MDSAAKFSDGDVFTLHQEGDYGQDGDVDQDYYNQNQNEDIFNESEHLRISQVCIFSLIIRISP